jgi:hypothetical protein
LILLVSGRPEGDLKYKPKLGAMFFCNLYMTVLLQIYIASEIPKSKCCSYRTKVKSNIAHQRNQQLHNSTEISWCRTKCTTLEETEKTAVNVENCV